MPLGKASTTFPSTWMQSSLDIKVSLKKGKTTKLAASVTEAFLKRQEAPYSHPRRTNPLQKIPWIKKNPQQMKKPVDNIGIL